MLQKYTTLFNLNLTFSSPLEKLERKGSFLCNRERHSTRQSYFVHSIYSLLVYTCGALCTMPRGEATLRLVSHFSLSLFARGATQQCVSAWQWAWRSIPGFCGDDYCAENKLPYIPSVTDSELCPSKARV